MFSTAFNMIPINTSSMSTRNGFLPIEHAFFTNYLNKKNSRTHKKVVRMCLAVELLQNEKRIMNI